MYLEYKLLLFEKQIKCLDLDFDFHIKFPGYQWNIIILKLIYSVLIIFVYIFFIISNSYFFCKKQ